MKYPVKITETLQRTIEVEADSRADAEEKAEELWNKVEIVLDSNDFKGASFHAEETVEKIQILVVKPGKRPERAEIGLELKDMQAVVGGDIEEYQPFDDEAAVVCNAEGKINRLPPNRAIYSRNGELMDVIAGTFFVCNAPISSDTFQSLSEEQIEKYERMFQDPERFQRTASGIQVHKIRHSKEQER